jgi:beta-glucosidase
MKRILILIALTLALPSLAENPPYKNPKLSPEERAHDLLGRMTPHEKTLQLQCIWQEGKHKMFTQGEFDIKKAAQVYPDGIGHIVRPNEDYTGNTKGYHPAYGAREGAKQYNAIQRYFVEHTRLGIPALFHDEGVHGVWTQDATCFPTPLALGCTWDTELIHDIYQAVALEMRSRGSFQSLGPVVDVVHDPRWGRTDETLGEDPWLNASLATTIVKAMQGTTSGYLDENHVGVTLKHFGVHGAPEGGCNTAPSFMDEHEARTTFLAPFRDVIEAANPFYVMVTYNELWGRPAHANDYLLRHILRQEYGFKGVVVSDYDGITRIWNVDHQQPTLADAAVAALQAGVDVEFPERNGYLMLDSLVTCRRIPQSLVDSAVYKVLVNKFRLGLFDHPYVDPDRADRVNGCDAHRRLAYKAACEAMVLLKNDGMLPLDSTKVKTIALIGPNADRCILGGYSGVPKDTISPLRAMRERFGKRMKILYAEGCRLTDVNSPFPLKIHAYSAEANSARIEEAVEVARQADVVVLFVGGNEGMSREAYSWDAKGDLSSLELRGGQKELIDRIAALGKPVCAMVNGGTTYNLQPLEAKVPAVMQCWYLGQEGGYAMADALFGKVNPSGKLTISMPRDAGHIPAYYNHKPSSRLGYNLDDSVEPLHPFGFGLSYTTFNYANLNIDRTTMKADETATVSVDITNTGKCEGAEVVQLYITDDYASMTRPVKELRGFSRVNLLPGETRHVEFKVGRKELQMYDASNHLVVEPGTFTFSIGPDSVVGQRLHLTVK